MSLRSISLKRTIGVAATAVALVGGGLVLATGVASADPAGIVGTGGPTAAISDVTPAGVPVAGVVQSAVGATKIVPGKPGPGY